VRQNNTYIAFLKRSIMGLCTWLLASLAMANTPLTLDSCLHLAEQNNKIIQQSAIEVSKAEQVKSQALTKYFPQVSASAMGFHSLNPMIEVGIDDIRNAGVRDLLTTLYGNYGEALGLDNTLSFLEYGYQVGVTALQPVYMGGKIVAGNKLAQVGIEAAQLQESITQRDVLQEVEESYWLVVGLTD
jgi:outer membrane protein TolC